MSNLPRRSERTPKRKAIFSPNTYTLSKRQPRSTANPVLIKKFHDAVAFIKDHPDNKGITDPIQYHHIEKAITDFGLNNVYYLDPSKMITMDDYIRRKDFELLGSIIINTPEKMKTSYIKFVPQETELNYQSYHKYHQNLYLFTVGNQIVKIGGTKLSLAERFRGYQCGDDKCGRSQSNTNQKIHNTFYFYLLLGCPINFYGKSLKSTTYHTQILDYDILVNTQVYHIFESVYIGDFKMTYGEYPPLSQVSDPLFNPVKIMKDKKSKKKSTNTPSRQTSKYNSKYVNRYLYPPTPMAPMKLRSHLNFNRTAPVPMGKLNNKEDKESNNDMEPNILPKDMDYQENIEGDSFKVMA